MGPKTAFQRGERRKICVPTGRGTLIPRSFSPLPNYYVEGVTLVPLEGHIPNILYFFLSLTSVYPLVVGVERVTLAPDNTQ